MERLRHHKLWEANCLLSAALPQGPSLYSEQKEYLAKTIICSFLPCWPKLLPQAGISWTSSQIKAVNPRAIWKRGDFTFPH